MNGNFNGVQLRSITSLKISGPLTSFRVHDKRVNKLEQILQLGAPAVLILANQTIEGRIVFYSADLHAGYEITIPFTGLFE